MPPDTRCDVRWIRSCVELERVRPSSRTPGSVRCRNGVNPDLGEVRAPRVSGAHGVHFRQAVGDRRNGLSRPMCRDRSARSHRGWGLAHEPCSSPVAVTHRARFLIRRMSV